MRTDRSNQAEDLTMKSVIFCVHYVDLSIHQWSNVLT